MSTVRTLTFELLRKLDVKHFVSNPGSTEENFLTDFPKDFTFILALQEASVVGIADGLSQGLKKPVMVCVHTGAGLANGMGCLLTAYLNKTPLIVIAGQQTREMLLMEPFLTNVEATTLPKPWVKWSYEVMRPEDTLAALMRAYTMATQAPAGPVFLSLPLDLWDKKVEPIDVFRTTSLRVGPDPTTLDFFADRLNQSKHPVLIYGGDIARSGAWHEALILAEKLAAPVWKSPLSESVSFPQDHVLYQGELPPAKGLLGKMLAKHDLALVVGAPVFRYYPWIPGDYLPKKTSLLHITDNPYDASKAPVGDALVSDAKLALQGLLAAIKDRHSVPYHPTSLKEKRNNMTVPAHYPLTAKQVFDVLSPLSPSDYVLVQESPSNATRLSQSGIGTITKPDSFYTSSSGGLGWGLPAAVGLALAEKESGRSRPVILIIGDGSFQYSPQAMWTGVQHQLHLIIISLRNEEYAILKSFAELEKTPNVPGLDLPGLDLVSIAKGYGAEAHHAQTIEEIQNTFQTALQRQCMTLIQIPIDKKIDRLLG